MNELKTQESYPSTEEEHADNISRIKALPRDGHNTKKINSCLIYLHLREIWVNPAYIVRIHRHTLSSKTPWTVVFSHHEDNIKIGDDDLETLATFLEVEDE